MTEVHVIMLNQQDSVKIQLEKEEGRLKRYRSKTGEDG